MYVCMYVSKAVLNIIGGKGAISNINYYYYVCVFVCVFMYVCMYVCIYVCVCIYACIYVCVYVCIMCMYGYQIYSINILNAVIPLVPKCAK